MALELHAFIGERRLPTREDWQVAIAGLAFPVELDPGLKVRGAEGFVPCTLESRPSGFELYTEPAAALLEDYPELAEQVGNRSSAITFRWGGDLRECACVMAAAAGLAACSDALLYYPDDEEWYGIDDLRRDFDACRSG
ncbi:MAG: hypothetical protein ACK47B_27775 [Armatimonadota bacterium]